MRLRLGDGPDPVDEGEGLGEVRETVRLREVVLVDDRPAPQLGEVAFDGLSLQRGDASPARVRSASSRDRTRNVSFLSFLAGEWRGLLGLSARGDRRLFLSRSIRGSPRGGSQETGARRMVRVPAPAGDPVFLLLEDGRAGRRDLAELRSLGLGQGPAGLAPPRPPSRGRRGTPGGIHHDGFMESVKLKARRTSSSSSTGRYNQSLVLFTPSGHSPRERALMARTAAPCRSASSSTAFRSPSQSARRS